MLLNSHTYYSFCYGTLSTEELLFEVASKDYDCFVISDINNTSACLDIIRLAKEKGLKPILGIDFRNGIHQQYIGIAKNNLGFKELNESLTKHLHENKDIEAIAPEFLNSYVVYPLQAYKGWCLRDNEFIGVTVKDLNRLPFLSIRKQYAKLVCLHPVTFANKKHFNAHRLLRAISKNTLLSKLDKTEQASPDEILLPKKNLYDTYREYPHIIQNTEQILKNCSIDFEYGKLSNKNLKYYTGTKEGDMALLRKECLSGLKYRFSNPGKEIIQRMEKELQVIEQMNFASYFLINWDITRYARSKNYYYVGRGSGANSLVAYLLRITDVDPVNLDLYFERFINIYRSNAPDFDIDFSWTDRDDITRYIFERFGNKRTALLATYSTFKKDAVIRELGKVFGLPSNEIDKLQNNQEDVIELDEFGRLVMKYSNLIKDFPRNLSVHSSGIIISEEEVTSYSATFLPPKGYPTTQFSMIEAEDMGLFKFDILSQRGLGKIKDALQIIKDNSGQEIDIHDTKKMYDDKRIKSLLKAGKCIGCFYIESPAMRMLLTKLQAEDYLRLVAASSIIRPGVSKSGMMREYILRYRNEALRSEAKSKLPELYNLLQETYGVMVYQEDVIKIAHFFAGLSLAEADYLRRGMSWKFKQRNEFHRVRDNFFRNCLKKGYEESVILEIWNQIESFANFAFSKGHSASYAVESYQALYLKAYFPLEYLVATINNGGGFYRRDIYFHEARMNGANIVPPCVNESFRETKISGKTIFMGFDLINGLETASSSLLLKERKENGPYKDLYDFVKRVSMSAEQISLLIQADAFRFTGEYRRKLLWNLYSVINPEGNKKERKRQRGLFDIKPKTYELPELIKTWVDDVFDEIELFGFTLHNPFQLLKSHLPNCLTAAELHKKINQSVEIVGYRVNVKETRTSKNEKMFFGTFIDLEGAWIDTVHFPPSAKAFPFRGPGCYLIKGKVVEEFDFISIEVSEMHRLATINREDPIEADKFGFETKAQVVN